MNDQLEFEEAPPIARIPLAKVPPVVYGGLTLLFVFVVFAADAAFASQFTLYGTALLATLGTLAMFASAVLRD